MSRDLRLAVVGFGSVGRRFVELLRGPYARILHKAGARVRVTGIATRRHGTAIDARGLPLGRCLAVARSDGSLDSLASARPSLSSRRFVSTVPADVLVEVTPLDPRQGEPATTHVRIALSRGLHVVTANKGPVAFAGHRLTALARRRDRFFLYEGAVMDGTPVFNLVARCLPGVRIGGFRGTLNTTTNHILSRMEEGRSAAMALREMQEQGIAEADPSLDLEGWDAAVKGCVLANGLMGGRVRPADVRRRGVGGLRPRAVRAALARGSRIRLVVRGDRVTKGVRVRVAPERIPFGDPLAVSGPDAVLVLDTDLMGEIALVERGATVDQTAYALLSDLVQIVTEGGPMPRRPRAGSGPGGSRA